MFIFSILKLGMDFIAGRAIALFNMRMQIATFIIDRWRVCLVLLILALGAIHYLSLRHQIKSAKAEVVTAYKALAAHMNADKEAAQKRQGENRLKEILAQKKTDALEAQHKAELSLIVQKGASNEIINNRTIANLRNELRSKLEGYQTARLSENDTDRLTIGNSNATVLERVQEELATCKEAGAIAAADYNFCKGYVDSQQSILGVSK